MARLAVVLALAGCVESPADLEGEYEVTISDQADGCMIASGPYPTFAMRIGQREDWAHVQLELGTDYMNRFFAPVAMTNGLTTSVDGSQIGGALGGKFVLDDEGCGFRYRIDLAAELDGDTLHGTVTVSDQMAVCAPACVTEQLFVATRLAP